MDKLWLWAERLRNTVFRGRADRLSADEMEFHLDMEIRERIRRGMPEAEARRTAMVDFGGVDRHRERVRERRWGHGFELIASDVRYGLRVLRRSPLFTSVALLTLMLSIGGTTTIFSVVNSVLLSPLPYGEPDDIVRLQQSWEGTDLASLSPAEHLDYAEQLTAFSSYGTYWYTSANLTENGEPEQISGVRASAGLLPAFAVPPQRGRLFTEEEDRSGARVVVISDALWKGRFAGDEAIIGRTVTMDGVQYEIVGVLPAGFRMPELLLSGGQSQFFRPLGITRSNATARGSHFLRAVGRLRPGVTVDEAAASAAQVAQRMVEDYPDDYPRDMGFRATVVPLSSQVRGPVRTPLTVLMVAVGFVLLIACVNVANLLVSRADGRTRELALRAAIGAGRGRLASQTVVESLILSLIGGGLGLAFAAAALRGLAPLFPSELSWLGQASIDGTVLGFAFLVSLATGLLFGVVPAFGLGHEDLRGALTESGRRSSDTRAGLALRRSLVVGELAVALVLLSGAGLLTRSFVAFLSVDPGIRISEVVSSHVSLPPARYQTDEEVRAFYRELGPRLAAIPGVINAAGVSSLPLANHIGDLNFRIEGREIAEGGISPKADWQVVTPGYFETMGLTPVRGRLITAADDASSIGVVVINETVARLHWPDEDAVGKRFVLGGQAGPGMVEIIGIVPGVRHEGLDQPEKPQMYLAHEQFRFWNGGGAATSMALVVHSTLPLGELRRPIARAVHELDPLLPLSSFATMEEIRAGSVAMPRLLMTLVGGFSLLSLLLAAVGIYGVMAQAVGRRTRELGIRLALGAEPRQVSRMMFGQGARLAGWGLVLGLIGTVLLTRLLATVLFGVTATDPLTLGTVSAILGTVALLACWIPVLRVTKLDPVRALKSD